MDRGVAIAALAGLGGMLGWGLADFFAKKTIDRIGDIVSLVWAHVAGSLLLLALAFVSLASPHTIHLPTDLHTWACLAIFGALQAAVYLFVYVGFGKGQVALLSPIFSSYSGVVALVAIAALGEHAGPSRLVALAVVFIGIVLINTDITALRERRVALFRVPGFIEIAVAAALATLWTLGWNQLVSGMDALSYACVMYLFMTATLFAYALVRRVPLQFDDRSVWLPLFFIGLCEVIAYAAISVGYADTSHTSVVALTSGAFSLPTIVLARIFLRERVSVIQTIGSLILILGIAAIPVL
jgi:drug/metabolite transporter (DMT)-like permease